MATRMKALRSGSWLCSWQGAAAQSGVDVSQAREIFSEIGGILQDLHEITGFKIKHRVPAEIITRDKVKEFLEQRMKEASSPEEIRVEELTLKKFGLVPQDFDLAKNTVDLLTEQAAAFYDFHRKRMFITDWTPSATREPALVHELGHALADQNVNLDKFIKQGQKSDDGSMARLAVMEGQASWLMAEYLARKAGQSLATSPACWRPWRTAIESGAGEFPVFESEPLYLRETLTFPYSQGLLFQNAVYQRMKQKSFEEVFRKPPVSTQQILHPDTYFSGSGACPSGAAAASGCPRIQADRGRHRRGTGSCHPAGAVCRPRGVRGGFAALAGRRVRAAGASLAGEGGVAVCRRVGRCGVRRALFRAVPQVLEKKWKHLAIESESDDALRRRRRRALPGAVDGQCGDQPGRR
jgi:hypothetical protein